MEPYSLNITAIEALNSEEKRSIHKCLRDEAKRITDIQDYIFAVIEYDYGKNNKEYDLVPLHIKEFQKGGYINIYLEFNQLLDVVYSF